MREMEAHKAKRLAARSEMINLAKVSEGHIVQENSDLNLIVYIF